MSEIYPKLSTAQSHDVCRSLAKWIITHVEQGINLNGLHTLERVNFKQSKQHKRICNYRFQSIQGAGGFAENSNKRTRLKIYN